MRDNCRINKSYFDTINRTTRMKLESIEDSSALDLGIEEPSLMVMQIRWVTYSEIATTEVQKNISKRMLEKIDKYMEEH